LDPLNSPLNRPLAPPPAAPVASSLKHKEYEPIVFNSVPKIKQKMNEMGIDKGFFYQYDPIDTKNEPGFFLNPAQEKGGGK
jgi:hypothetical protein